MAMQWWKIGRECHRIGQRIQACIEFFAEPIRKRQYDASRNTALKLSYGSASVHKKIAILLIYQPGGIADSTLWTCAYLVSKGYAPLVISNAPVPDQDKNKLLQTIWRMVERPNFGYDFGGYRDAIWLLDQWKITPDNLIILNDSVWFPVGRYESLIDEMEADAADFVGALQVGCSEKTSSSHKKKRPFFASFFLMIKRKAIQDPAFSAFWKNYRITNNKYKTIRRGERGFSHAMFDAGIQSNAMYTHEKLDRYIAALDCAGLRKELENLVTADDTLAQQLCGLNRAFIENDTWRRSAIQMAMTVTQKQNFLSTAPVLSLTEFKVPYLKKSRDVNNLKSLDLVDRKIAAGALVEVEPCVRSEVHRLVRSVG